MYMSLVPYYSIYRDSNVDILIKCLDNETSNKFVDDKHFKMNIDKCNLLVTNHEDEVYATVMRLLKKKILLNY